MRRTRRCTSRQTDTFTGCQTAWSSRLIREAAAFIEREQESPRRVRSVWDTVACLTGLSATQKCLLELLGRTSRRSFYDYEVRQKNILADTSGFAGFARRRPRHIPPVRALAQKGHHLLPTSVLCEVSFMARARVGADTAQTFLEEDAVSSGAYASLARIYLM